jgi:hypothetical protein
MKRRTVTLVIFLLFSSLAFVSPRLASSFAELRPGVEPQRRAQTGRRVRRAQRPAKPQVNYSKFNHSRPEHAQKSCDSCHTIVALNVRTPSGEPSGAVDIKDYPKHESCLECHRQQFFKGARPAICSNCHNVVSPKSDLRFPFPKLNARPQFALSFAHKSHFSGSAQDMFKKIIGPKANIQASCVFCHKEDAREFKPAKGAPEGTFAPAAGTFMTTPTSHATCFQCHFQKDVKNREQPPLANECAKCHNIVAATPPTAAAATATTSAASTGGQKPTPTPVAAHTTVQKPAPSPTPIVAHNITEPWADRLAQKFPHAKKEHKERAEEKPGDVEKIVAITCTQCHAAVRKAESLEELSNKKNHVQLPSCSSSACHTAFSGKSTLMQVSLFRELQGRGKDSTFNCAVCHTPPTSTAADVPCSHYVAVYNGAKKDADEQKVKWDNKRAKARTPEQIKETLDKRLQSVRDLTPQRCQEQLK